MEPFFELTFHTPINIPDSLKAKRV